MKKQLLFAGLMFIPLLAGCTVSDAIFAVLGDHYTEGGYTRADKERHYRHEVENSSHYAPWNP